MGLERVAFLMQGVENLYEIDEVRPVLDLAAELSGKLYGHSVDDDVRLRVVADHIRSALMLIGDGVTPGNDGRGYVLRRLLRRSIRAMRLMGVTKPVIGSLIEASMHAMKESYPELQDDFSRISSTAVAEEDAFLRTLTSGSLVLDQSIADVKSGKGSALAGGAAFLLHDTYGFPIDLTVEIAEEAGITVDREGFTSLMAEQRDRAKADAREKKLGGTDLSVYSDFRSKGVTKFTGYDELESSGRVLGLIHEGVAVADLPKGSVGEVILDTTSLYAESGGQAADAGLILGEGFELEVLDVQKPIKGLISHKVLVRSGQVSLDAVAKTQVDENWRLGACQAHSGTHVLHAALRQVLGPSALQSGSYNKPGYLRLDFAWNQALSAETKSELEEVSNLAIRRDLAVSAHLMSQSEAKNFGAVALFGETYDELVRVVQVGGPWSRELCGGTHVSRSSQIGLLALGAESSVGSGSRRIEAFVGIEAFRSLALERALVSRLADLAKVPVGSLEDKLIATFDELRSVQKRLASFEQQEQTNKVPQWLASAKTIGSNRVVFAEVGELDSAEPLRGIATQLRQELGTESVVFVSAVIADKPAILVACGEGARARGVKAGALVKLASSILGGGGGGKDDLAQGGGTDVSALPAAISAIEKELG
jgi:alanyl-tRNA synthetase